MEEIEEIQMEEHGSERKNTKTNERKNTRNGRKHRMEFELKKYMEQRSESSNSNSVANQEQLPRIKPKLEIPSFDAKVKLNKI
ncbi:hypothetical protein AVEN_104147-1 [Araneus ventricosus]|uniref:Uncharacterized protein n=1 Tax=Araneus ventricosus TaxID=182803 RepID=A0A4Y2M165_ARAVE|nr:hypothetical protein AVEN_104147-1 [Araneus ventricosus]